MAETEEIGEDKMQEVMARMNEMSLGVGEAVSQIEDIVTSMQKEPWESEDNASKIVIEI